MRICFLSKDRPIGRWGAEHIRSIFPTAEVEVHLAPLTDRPPLKLTAPRYEILLSLLGPWILKPADLERVDLPINFHPGPPEYPGFGCYNFAIYDSVTEYGVTAHMINEQIDAGDIVALHRFPVQSTCDLPGLQARSMENLKILFHDVLEQIRTGSELRSIASWARRATTRREFEALRKIPVDASFDEVSRRIRAFSHPDHQGAFIEIHGHRFYAGGE